jgi:threonine dehydrogenase-like Zn-dependent dehydrogenase
MQGAVLYGPRDVRLEERAAPTVVEPTDVVIGLSATCICGSDLWSYRGISATNGPTPMGHEYCGIVEEVGRAVRSIKRGQFVVGSFAASDNTCSHCRAGYRRRARTGSGWWVRRRPCCACRWRTARSWPHAIVRRTT